MYASIWKLRGNPDALAVGYESLIEEMGEEGLGFHACLRGKDGLLIVDTCPSREAFEEFRGAEWFIAALDRHGLPRPETLGFDLVAAFANGERIESVPD